MIDTTLVNKSKSLMWAILVVGAMISGCRSAPQSQPAATQPAPKPVRFKLDSVLRLGGPMNYRGQLQVKSKAQALTDEAERSRYEGRVSLRLIDGNSDNTTLNWDISLEGTTNEPPSDAVWNIFRGLKRIGENLGGLTEVSLNTHMQRQLKKQNKKDQ